MPSQWTPLGILALPLLALPLGFAPITQIEMKLVKLTQGQREDPLRPTYKNVLMPCHASPI
jgi:hypothetical protein